VLDCPFGAIADAPALSLALKEIVGVVEHGLFIGLARTVFVGRGDGVDVLLRRAPVARR
jgi:ribose 5-phosphate isomerase A